MIRLEVEEYCQQCLDFSPDVIKPEREISADIKGKQYVEYSDTIILCKHRKRCAGIKRFLEQHIKGASSE